MIFKNRHSMIDRYISGRMDAQEMKRFEEQLRTDDKLRSIYETDRAIQQAMLKDRASIPANHASLQSNVMKTLAMVSPQHTITPTVSAGGSAVLGSAVMKMVIGIVGALGIFSGVVWFVSSWSPDPAGITQPATRSSETASPVQETPLVPQSDPSAEPAETPATTTRQITEPVPARVDPDVNRLTQSDRTAKEIFSKRNAQASPGATVVTPDSVQIKLKLDVNKSRKEE